MAKNHLHLRTIGLKTNEGKEPKIVLVLSGAADTGKSTALVALGRTLLDNAHYYYEEKKKSNSRDRMIVVKYRRWLIGIATAGDNAEYVKSGLDFIKKQRCDIAIIAVRTSDDSPDDMLSFCRKCVNVKENRIASVEKIDAPTPNLQAEAINAFVKKVLYALDTNKYDEVAARYGRETTNTKR